MCKKKKKGIQLPKRCCDQDRYFLKGLGLHPIYAHPLELHLNASQQLITKHLHLLTIEIVVQPRCLCNTGMPQISKSWANACSALFPSPFSQQWRGRSWHLQPLEAMLLPCTVFENHLELGLFTQLTTRPKSLLSHTRTFFAKSCQVTHCPRKCEVPFNKSKLAISTSSMEEDVFNRYAVK